MIILTIFYFFFNKYFFKISFFFIFSAVLKETIRDAFINRFCIIVSLAPVIILEDFSSRILCLQMKI